MKTTEKFQLSGLLEETGVLTMVFGALHSQLRTKILSALLRHEATSEKPMAYTELKQSLCDVASNKLSYHLDLLQEAGLIKQLTKLSLEGASEETGYRSFYKISALTTLVLRPWLEWLKAR